jgi:hypothetical protein
MTPVTRNPEMTGRAGVQNKGLRGPSLVEGPRWSRRLRARGVGRVSHERTRIGAEGTADGGANAAADGAGFRGGVGHDDVADGNSRNDHTRGEGNPFHCDQAVLDANELASFVDKRFHWYHLSFTPVQKVVGPRLNVFRQWKPSKKAIDLRRYPTRPPALSVERTVMVDSPEAEWT